MRLAFATTFDALNIDNWSGTPLHMIHALAQQNIEVHPIGGLKRRLPFYFKCLQFLKKQALNQRESPRFNTLAAQFYSEQVSHALRHQSVDAIIAPRINPIAYLNCKEPLVLWTDALYASLLCFYPGFISHSFRSIEQGNLITRECLSRCKLVLFSSDWAARTATEIYGIRKEKVKVVPFGANIPSHHTFEEIKTMIRARPKNKIQLLFIGKHWERKGGDIVLKVAEALHHQGHAVELHLLGSSPKGHHKIPDYVKCHGFVSKKTPEGLAKITQLLRESHFLFVPSRAEAFGIVFCEANAFGLPCLTSHVGGIPTIVKDHINGMAFSLETTTEMYCDYIINVMQQAGQYEAMALSSFAEYQARLNWDVATRQVKSLVQDIL